MKELFIFGYILPFIIVLLGAGSWAERQTHRNVGILLLVLALLPAVNIAVAIVAILGRIHQVFVPKRKA
jgi:hypothetical protein